MYQSMYNPAVALNNRLMQYDNPQYSHNTQSQSFNTIPVSNIDEANAYRVDMFGTPTFFYNGGTGEVYLKKTNQQGLSDFIIFKQVASPNSSDNGSSNTNSYEDVFKAINDKLDILLAKEKPEDYSLIEKKKKKGVEND